MTEKAKRKPSNKVLSGNYVSRKKKCAVCGDTHTTNVRLVWKRTSDQKEFDICMMCAEAGKVNAESVDTYGGGK